jgi:hypothetical protein
MGRVFFRSPLFADLRNNEHFQLLEASLSTELGLQPGSVFLSDIHFTSDDYLQVQVRLFPSTGTSFNLSEITRIGFDLSNQTYKPPQGFGPYYFVADPYVHFAGIKIIKSNHVKLCLYASNYAWNTLGYLVSGADDGGKSQVSTGAVAGIAVACGLILIAVTSGAIFALLQKRRSRELSGQTNPFGEIPNNIVDNCIPLIATKYFFKKKNIKLSECVFHGCTI